MDCELHTAISTQLHIHTLRTAIQYVIYNDDEVRLPLSSDLLVISDRPTPPYSCALEISVLCSVAHNASAT